MNTALACLFIPLSALLAAPAQDHLIPLADNWRLQSGASLGQSGADLSRPGIDTAAWHAVEVPKTVLAALVAAGVYPDPYHGLNMKSIPGYQDGSWLVQKADSPFRASWWYRTEFDLPERQAHRVYTLHFDGINYKANIWLNGQLVAGETDVVGMFRRFEFPVTEQLVYGGKNVLAVEIIPPGLLPDKRYHTKQLEATTGWDDHNPQPPDMNMGIWQPVYLREQGPVSLRHPYVETELDLPGLAQARLTASAWLRNNTDQPVSCVFSGAIEGRTFSQEVTLAPGELKEALFTPDAFPALVVDAPRVWWPHPVGSQELYEASFRVAVGDQPSDSASTKFGIRDITTYINEDNWRGYRVNGRNILIRGGAWMTTDMMLNLEKSRYEALVRYAREANLNMLRLEGFSIRETNMMYDICDQYGVMVTQQLFGRNLPDEALAIACIEDTLLRIRNHPSLAHFLGHDETFPTETLDAAYISLLEKHRIRRTYQPHSGTFNIATRAKTGGTRTGTRELWTYASPAHYFLVKERPFDSAWGFAQSGGIGGILAARDSLRQMMPESQLWPVKGNEIWSFHTVTQGMDYFDVVFKNLEQCYGAPKDLDDFCGKLYAMNYSSARGMFEAYARFKYESLGITTWKYDAAWPAALTWQYVDWYKRPTAAYYGAKKACTPVHALYAQDDGSLFVVNSLYAPQSGLKLHAALGDMNGALVVESDFDVSVEADGCARAGAVVPPDSISNPYFLKLNLKDGAGATLSENTYWLSKTPDIPGASGQGLNDFFYTRPKSVADFTGLNTLPKTRLDALAAPVDGGFEIIATNNSGTIAFLAEFALLDSEGGLEVAPAYWTDNYLVLFPGESRKIKVSLPAETPAPTHLRVQGYNVEKTTLPL